MKALFMIPDEITISSCIMAVGQPNPNPMLE